MGTSHWKILECVRRVGGFCLFVPPTPCPVLADFGKNLFTGPIYFLAISDPFYIGTRDF